LPAADNALILIFFAAFLLAPLKYIAHLAQPFHRLTVVRVLTAKLGRENKYPRAQRQFPVV
jgi:hypothetical protein